MIARIGAVLRMKQLDWRTPGEVTWPESLPGTMDWLRRAQDATPNDGVAALYNWAEGWRDSYPETTGYIIQSFLLYYERLQREQPGQDHEDWFDRARRMAVWEVETLNADGGTPGVLVGAEKPADCISVAFNTGQFGIGLGCLLARYRDKLDPQSRATLEDGARRILAYLSGCCGDDGYFEGGLSYSSVHGRLSHNLMTSWGMLWTALAMGEEAAADRDRAIRSVEYYMAMVDERAWPTNTGIDEWEADFPRTHALGYHAQGVLESGLLLDREDMITRAQQILDAALPLIGPDGHFPGRIHAGWKGGPRWVCLTGSSQFAICYAHMAVCRGEKRYLDPARRLIEDVMRTQVKTHANPAVNFAIRGSAPFSPKGYNRGSFPNWAAKFHADSIMVYEDAVRKLG